MASQPNLVDITQDVGFFPIIEEKKPTKKKKKKKKKGTSARSRSSSPKKGKKKKGKKKKKKKTPPKHPDGSINYGRPQTKEFGRRRIERIRRFYGKDLGDNHMSKIDNIFVG